MVIVNSVSLLERNETDDSSFYNYKFVILSYCGSRIQIFNENLVYCKKYMEKLILIILTINISSNRCILYTEMIILCNKITNYWISFKIILL